MILGTWRPGIFTHGFDVWQIATLGILRCGLSDSCGPAIVNWIEISPDQV